jgi:hypothetical protein
MPAIIQHAQAVLEEHMANLAADTGGMLVPTSKAQAGP